jgi:drug/metabolite transporter (DMT)-like permease
MRPRVKSSDQDATAPPTDRTAVVALLIATVFWGTGFTWAKAAGEAVNAAAGLTNGAPLGPIWVLGFRFTAAAILWLAIFPQSRRGWNGRIVRRSMTLACLLGGGMALQHLGLDRSTEAVSAFLTSLTILFVPVLMTVVLRRPPNAVVWFGVVLATVGVWLMTGASPSGFGIGEALGLACAIVYAVDIIAVDRLVMPADAPAMTVAQFLLVGVGMLIVAALLAGGRQSLAPRRVMELLVMPKIGVNVALLAGLPSIVSYGIQFRFQPRIDPTRAALIYLIEPVVAALYAFVATGRGLGWLAVVGAGLILAANLLVEVLKSRGAGRRRNSATVLLLWTEPGRSPSEQVRAKNLFCWFRELGDVGKTDNAEVEAVP